MAGDKIDKAMDKGNMSFYIDSLPFFIRLVNQLNTFVDQLSRLAPHTEFRTC